MKINLADSGRKTLVQFWSILGHVGSRAVLTNGHTGHVPRAPDFLFFLRGPQLVVVK